MEEDFAPDEPLRAPTMQELGPTDPREIGPYRLIGRLGHGGMGIAYLGESDDQIAVLKLLGQGAALSDADVARWERELEAMRAAASPRTVHLLEHDFTGRPAWFAMEFVRGATLQFHIQHLGVFQTRDLVPFSLGLAEAIGDIHRAGVVHRDLKPSNVMLSPTGPRIIDFGVAALADATMLTKTGHIVGTVGWLAPEQIKDDTYSAATDIHAWALCVLFASTGENPYASESSGAALYKIVNETPSAPDSMPPRLARLVEQALSKDPDARPELQTIINDLRDGADSPVDRTRIVRGRPPQNSSAGSRRGLVAAGIAAVAGGVVAGVAVGRMILGG